MSVPTLKTPTAMLMFVTLFIKPDHFSTASAADVFVTLLFLLATTISIIGDLIIATKDEKVPVK